VSSSRTENAGGLIDVTMPQMGVSVAEGTVVQWRMAVGDPVSANETVCEISTDKIDTEVPAPVSGVLAEVLVEVGETVPVGVVLARIEGAGGSAPPAPAAAAAPDVPAAAAAPDVPAAADAITGPDAPAGPATRVSPVVGRIAAEHGIDLALVTGTGRDGRVRKQDVLAYLERAGSEGGTNGAAVDAPLHIESPYRPDPAPPAGPVADGSLSRMRRQIGEHMKRSLDTAATCTTWIEVDMSRVERARASLKLTALAFVARACVAALREHPELNASLEGERYVRHDEIHLGIAVSLGDDGLIVPVIHGAHELSEEGLAARIKDLARRARARELTPDDVRGGTFTITNPGQFGSIMATPIINQPQVAILDLEAVVKRPVVVSDADGNDSIAIRPMTILGLSWDHRALDGVQAAQFLAAVKAFLEGLPAA
jgi:2-oxoglutarate dehydrogenase E2 component (dihydrolipoamide succinyltransferase)